MISERRLRKLIAHLEVRLAKPITQPTSERCAVMARRVKRSLERILPYEEWVRRVNPTAEQKELYWSVVQDFRTLLAAIEAQGGTRH